MGNTHRELRIIIQCGQCRETETEDVLVGQGHQLAMAKSFWTRTVVGMVRVHQRLEEILRAQGPRAGGPCELGQCQLPLVLD